MPFRPFCVIIIGVNFHACRVLQEIQNSECNPLVSYTIRRLRAQVLRDSMRLRELQSHPEFLKGTELNQMCDELSGGLEVKIAILKGLEDGEDGPPFGG